MCHGIVWLSVVNKLEPRLKRALTCSPISPPPPPLPWPVTVCCFCFDFFAFCLSARLWSAVWVCRGFIDFLFLWCQFENRDFVCVVVFSPMPTLVDRQRQREKVWSETRLTASVLNQKTQTHKRLKRNADFKKTIQHVLCCPSKMKKRGCTSGGVYVSCICTHARWKLLRSLLLYLCTYFEH